MFTRLLVFPFYFVAFVATLGFPVVAGMLLYEGGIQNYLILLVFLGVYPMLLTMSHAALIEHFIAKKLKQGKMASDYLA